MSQDAHPIQVNWKEKTSRHHAGAHPWSDVVRVGCAGEGNGLWQEGRNVGVAQQGRRVIALQFFVREYAQPDGEEDTSMRNHEQSVGVL